MIINCPPLELIRGTISKAQATLQFKNPDHHDFLRLQVQFRPAQRGHGRAEEWRSASIYANASGDYTTTYRLTNLQPGTKFDVRVRMELATRVDGKPQFTQWADVKLIKGWQAAGYAQGFRTKEVSAARRQVKEEEEEEQPQQRQGPKGKGKAKAKTKDSPATKLATPAKRKTGKSPSTPAKQKRARRQQQEQQEQPVKEEGGAEGEGEGDSAAQNEVPQAAAAAAAAAVEEEQGQEERHQETPETQDPHALLKPEPEPEMKHGPEQVDPTPPVAPLGAAAGEPDDEAPQQPQQPEPEPEPHDGVKCQDPMCHGACATVVARPCDHRVWCVPCHAHNKALVASGSVLAFHCPRCKVEVTATVELPPAAIRTLMEPPAVCHHTGCNNAVDSATSYNDEPRRRYFNCTADPENNHCLGGFSRFCVPCHKKKEKTSCSTCMGEDYLDVWTQRGRAE